MNTNKPDSSLRVKAKRRRMRQEVLKEAKALLLLEGPDAVTLGAVSNRLGMTKPAIYHYFPSKEALTRSLIASLIDEEITQLEAALERADPDDHPIAVMIREFHSHYRKNLHAFRFVYGQLQLYVTPDSGFDAEMARTEITPRTRHLFDRMELLLVPGGQESRQRRRMRRLAFAAWMSVLGLMTMIAIAEGMDDPLLYPDEELLDTIVSVFGNATLASDHE